MTDAHPSYPLAAADTAVPRDGASALVRRLRAVARWILQAMHESRRRQAEAVLRRHAHLFQSAAARRTWPDERT
jgi:hypothetical protein